MENLRVFWIIILGLNKSNRPQVSMVYRLINHLGCWKNTRRIWKSIACGSWSTNSSSVLPRGVCESADPCLFSPNPSIRQKFCSNPKPQRHPKTEVLRFKGKLVHVNATVNFTQIVKKATCLMAITQYNFNNSLTPELKRSFLLKKK